MSDGDFSQGAGGFGFSDPAITLANFFGELFLGQCDLLSEGLKSVSVDEGGDRSAVFLLVVFWRVRGRHKA